MKWPNDLLSGEAKLGGILLEMAGDAAGTCQVVVGVGLNVAMPDAAAGEIDQAWTDLDRLGAEPAPGRNRLLAALLNELLVITSYSIHYTKLYDPLCFILAQAPFSIFPVATPKRLFSSLCK